MTARSEPGVEAYQFGAFQIDCAERELWHDGQRVELRGKAFELLALLVRNAGRTVDKAALMDALWSNVAVHENNIAVTVRAIRKALRERDPDAAFIETVPRRGYRWVQPAHAFSAPPSAPMPAVQADRGPAPAEPRGAAEEPFVGRNADLLGLRRRWDAASTGSGTVTFISGEAGIGKSALVRRFLGERARASGALVLSGQCLQLLGVGEPYLPWLGALDAALAGPEKNVWLSALQRHAAAWCLRLPQHFGAPSSAPRAEAAAAWQRPSLGPRELVDALLFIAAHRPLLVVVEDLHWADASSIDVLRLLESRLERRRLLLLLTYRPADIDLLGCSAPHRDSAHAKAAFGASAGSPEPAPHSLRTWLLDLAGRERRDELYLRGLEREDLELYLCQRFGASAFTAELSHALWRRTEGHPLFATRLIRALVDGAQLAVDRDGRWALHAGASALDSAAAQSIEAVIRGQFERLTPLERHTLEVASIYGAEFGVAVVARLLREQAADVADRLDRLARLHRLLERASEDVQSGGRNELRYRFSHVLFQNFVYAGLSRDRRRDLHGRAGRALLALHPDAARCLPWELALHFERGEDFVRAVAYFTAAGDRAERAHAKQEALACYERARALLEQLPSEQRKARDIVIVHGQGWASFGLRRFGDAERYFRELLRLSDELGAVIARPGGDPDDGAFHYFTQPWQDAMMQRPARIFPLSAGADLCAELRAEALHCCCYVIDAAGRTEELGMRAGELLAHSQNMSSAPRHAEALVWLGRHALGRGDLHEARERLDAALDLAHQSQHERALHLALHLRATLHLLVGELALARAAYERLLPGVPDARTAAEALLGVGEARAKQGELRTALEAYRSAQQLLQRIRPGFPALHGWVLRELGQHDAACELDRVAVERLRELDEPVLFARTSAELARSLCWLGELVAAERHLDEAEATIPLEQRRCPARTNSLRAARCELYHCKGQLDHVSELATEWSVLAMHQGDKDGLRVARRWLGRTALDQGRLEEARHHLEVAVNISQTHPAFLTDWRSYALLHQWARCAGDAPLAERTLHRVEEQLRELAAGLDEPSERERLGLFGEQVLRAGPLLLGHQQ